MNFKLSTGSSRLATKGIINLHNILSNYRFASPKQGQRKKRGGRGRELPSNIYGKEATLPPPHPPISIKVVANKDLKLGRGGGKIDSFNWQIRPSNTKYLPLHKSLLPQAQNICQKPISECLSFNLHRLEVKELYNEPRWSLHSYITLFQEKMILWNLILRNLLPGVSLLTSTCKIIYQLSCCFSKSALLLNKFRMQLFLPKRPVGSLNIDMCFLIAS